MPEKKKNNSAESSIEHGITTHRDVDSSIGHSGHSGTFYADSRASTSAVTDDLVIENIDLNGLTFKGFNTGSTQDFKKCLSLSGELIVKYQLSISFLDYFFTKFSQSFPNTELSIGKFDIRLMNNQAKKHGIIPNNDELWAHYKMLFAIAIHTLAEKEGVEPLARAFAKNFHDLSNNQEKLLAHNTGFDKKCVSKTVKRSDNEIHRIEYSRQSNQMPHASSHYTTKDVVEVSARKPFKHDGKIVDQKYIERFAIDAFFTFILKGKSSICEKITPSCCSKKLSIPDKREKSCCNFPVGLLTGRGQGPKMRCLTDTLLGVLMVFSAFALISRVGSCIIVPGDDILSPTTNDTTKMSKCFSEITFESLRTTVIVFGVSLFCFILRKACIRSHNNSLRDPIRKLCEATGKMKASLFEKKNDVHEEEQLEEGLLLPSTSGGVSTAHSAALKDVVVNFVEYEVRAAHSV